jgi:hypothetical protein
MFRIRILIHIWSPLESWSASAGKNADPKQEEVKSAKIEWNNAADFHTKLQYPSVLKHIFIYNVTVICWKATSKNNVLLIVGRNVIPLSLDPDPERVLNLNHRSPKKASFWFRSAYNECSLGWIRNFTLQEIRCIFTKFRYF